MIRFEIPAIAIDGEGNEEEVRLKLCNDDTSVWTDSETKSVNGDMCVNTVYGGLMLHFSFVPKNPNFKAFRQVVCK